MDDLAVGRVFRLTRIRDGLRQREVSAPARVSQSIVSLIERGRIEAVSLSKIRRVGSVLGIRVLLEPRLRSGEASRLLDRDHARIVERLAHELRALGWEVIPEFTFNHFGERGSVDVLAWHAATRTLLLVEVKTRLVDVQALLASENRKARIVPGLAERDLKWDAAAVGRLLVVERTTANRTVARDHASTLEAVYPDNARRVRGWLRRPSGSVRCLWLRSPNAQTTRTPLRQRVRSREMSSLSVPPPRHCLGRGC